MYESLDADRVRVRRVQVLGALPKSEVCPFIYVLLVNL